jgi:hypothetical protein
MNREKREEQLMKIGGIYSKVEKRAIQKTYAVRFFVEGHCVHCTNTRRPSD